MSDFSVQRGSFTVAAGTTSHTVTITAVGSLSSALERITAVHRAGQTGPTTSKYQGDHATTIELTATDTLTFTFPSGTTQQMEVYWEVIEYTGASGGPHEFIVRHRGVETFTSTSITVTLDSTIGTLGDAVPFVSTWYQGDTSNAYGYWRRFFSKWVLNSTTEAAGTIYEIGFGPKVSLVVVEFTGSSWSVQSTTGDTSTTGTNTTVSITAVSDWTQAFIECSWSTDWDSDLDGSFLVYYPGSSTSQVTLYTVDYARPRHYALYVIENSDLSVEHDNSVDGSLTGATTSDTTMTYTVGSVTMSEAALFVSGITNSPYSDPKFGSWTAELATSTSVKFYRYATGYASEFSYQLLDLSGMVGTTTYTQSVAGSASSSGSPSFRPERGSLGSASSSGASKLQPRPAMVGSASSTGTKLLVPANYKTGIATPGGSKLLTPVTSMDGELGRSTGYQALLESTYGSDLHDFYPMATNGNTTTSSGHNLTQYTSGTNWPDPVYESYGAHGARDAVRMAGKKEVWSINYLGSSTTYDMAANDWSVGSWMRVVDWVPSDNSNGWTTNIYPGGWKSYGFMPLINSIWTTNWTMTFYVFISGDLEAHTIWPSTGKTVEDIGWLFLTWSWDASANEVTMRARSLDGSLDVNDAYTFTMVPATSTYFYYRIGYSWSSSTSGSDYVSGKHDEQNWHMATKVMTDSEFESLYAEGASAIVGEPTNTPELARPGGVTPSRDRITLVSSTKTGELSGGYYGALQSIYGSNLHRYFPLDGMNERLAGNEMVQPSGWGDLEPKWADGIGGAPGRAFEAESRSDSMRTVIYEADYSVDRIKWDQDWSWSGWVSVDSFALSDNGNGGPYPVQCGSFNNWGMAVYIQGATQNGVVFRVYVPGWENVIAYPSSLIGRWAFIAMSYTSSTRLVEGWVKTLDGGDDVYVSFTPTAAPQNDTNYALYEFGYQWSSSTSGSDYSTCVVRYQHSAFAQQKLTSADAETLFRAGSYAAVGYEKNTMVRSEAAGVTPSASRAQLPATTMDGTSGSTGVASPMASLVKTGINALAGAWRGFPKPTRGGSVNPGGVIAKEPHTALVGLLTTAGDTLGLVALSHGGVTTLGGSVGLLAETFASGLVGSAGAHGREAQPVYAGVITSGGGTSDVFVAGTLTGVMTTMGRIRRLMSDSFEGGEVLVFSGSTVHASTTTVRGGFLSLDGAPHQTLVLSPDGVMTMTRAPVTSRVGKLVDGIGGFLAEVSKMTLAESSATVHPGGTTTNQPGLPLAGQVTPAMVVGRLPGVVRSGAVSIAQLVNSAVSRSKGGQLSPGHSRTKKVFQAISGDSGGSGEASGIRTSLLTIVGSFLSSGNLKNNSQTPLEGTFVQGGTVTPIAGKVSTGTVQPAAVISRHPSIGVEGSVLAAGDTSRAARFYWVLSGIVTMAGVLTRRTGSVLTAVVTLVGAVAKRIGKRLAGAVSWVGQIIQSIIRADWTPWTKRKSTDSQYTSVAREVYEAAGVQYLSVPRADYESISTRAHISVKD